MAGLAPDPQFPERVGPSYETTMAPAQPGNRGPLRFEEGLATDTDIPDDFIKGMNEGSITAPGQPNMVNPDTQYKHAAEVLKERAHPGSASWVDSPPYLGAFASGAAEGNTVEYVQENRSGARTEILNAAVVTD
jgi:hypothetical protein